jgi:hypothetical protein
MVTVLSIAGLVVSSLASLVLLAHELSEKTKKANQLEQLGRLKHRAELFQQLVRESVQSVVAVNKQLGGEAYNVDTETAKTRESLERAQKELRDFEAASNTFLANMITPQQLIGFVGLLAGFVLQLAAELVKVFMGPQIGG